MARSEADERRAGAAVQTTALVAAVDTAGVDSMHGGQGHRGGDAMAFRSVDCTYGSNLIYNESTRVPWWAVGGGYNRTIVL